MSRTKGSIIARLMAVATAATLSAFLAVGCGGGDDNPTGGTTGGKTDPSVTWPTGLTATVGQTLSQIALPGNVGTPGVFTWTNPAAPVGEAGQRSHSMTFTPTDAATYNALQNNVTVTVSGSSGGGERDGRLVLEAGYAWVDNYPAGERDGLIFKADGTYQEISDSNGPWEINGTGTWSTSGNSVLSFLGAESYSFLYTVTNTTLTFSGSNGSYVLTKTAVTIGGQVTPPDAEGTNPDIGTGSQESRRYRVEVYNINSATYDALDAAYKDKRSQDVVRADVISRGHTAANIYTNQTFSDVLSRYSTMASSAGVSSSNIAPMLNVLTEALQTNNRSGQCIWIRQGSTYRFFYVNETSLGYYTVEVYNINSATYAALDTAYKDKRSQDIVRADVISRGHAAANTYTNQTFSDVLSRYSTMASSAGVSSSNIAPMLNVLTEALQTNNRSGQCIWIRQGSTYRFFYVSQE